MIKDLINCDNAIDYIRLMTGKVAIKKVIDLDAGVFAVKKDKSIVLGVVKIDGDNIQR